VSSILIANKAYKESRSLADTLDQDFKVSIIASPNEYDDKLMEQFELVLLDHNFTENSGIDFLMSILGKFYIPVLMLTPPEDPQCAVEAMRAGAYNYIVKAGDFNQVLNISVKEALEKFNAHEQMKQTIIQLKEQVAELQNRLSLRTKSDTTETPEAVSLSKPKDNIIQEIISRFKRGEINLPSLPQITIKFSELVNKGADLQKVAELLRQDVAISSKLISVSNTVYYRGMAENKTLEQAINRLGLGVTKQYVDVLSNRSLYTTRNKKYAKIIENLWEHSLSCAYASQIVSQTLKRRQTGETFTMGLLHDIGQLVLLGVVAELKTKGKFENGTGKDDLFENLYSFHGKFGAILLNRWQFPASYIEIAKYHNSLEKADSVSKNLIIVHFSNLLVKTIGYNPFQQTEIDLEGAESTKLLKLKSNSISIIKDKVKKVMDGMRDVLSS